MDFESSRALINSEIAIVNMDKDKKIGKNDGGVLNSADPFLYDVLKQNAKENRGHSTEAESLLWEQLRGNKLGIHFRRQHVIGQYIADFVSLKEMLVIEVDGGYHGDSEQQLLDEARTGYLNSRGFKVLRFTNNQVLNNLEEVMSTIIHSFN